MYLFYENDEDRAVPYQMRISSSSPLTLSLLKHHLPSRTRKRNRYYFKRVDEISGQVVREEIRHDHELLPLYDGKIVVLLKEA